FTSFFFLLLRPPPRSPLFPYTTLFRSPRSRYAFDLRLAAEFSFRAYLASNTSYFRSKRAELIDHRVDSVLQLKYLAFYVYCDLRSEEHTSELQSRSDLVCRLLLEKKKK